MKTKYFGLIFGILILFPTLAMAHFGMIIPSDSMISQHESRKLSLNLSFSHPFEMVGMEMSKPDTFLVFHEDKKNSLLSNLRPFKVMSHRAWKTTFQIKRPGVYAFYMKPTPYWEPAEDCFIIHHTKTVIAAFGNDEGWEKELGVETEIVPLSRPMGLYTGNIFQGIVKLNGKAVPYATVEVEYFNENQKAKAPNELMIAQTIKADKNGVFSYATPSAGWWGFAALNTANYKLKHNGEEKDVELGAVLWVKFHDFSMK